MNNNDVKKEILTRIRDLNVKIRDIEDALSRFDIRSSDYINDKYYLILVIEKDSLTSVLALMAV